MNEKKTQQTENARETGRPTTLILTCPHCGNKNFYHKDDGYECVACGEFSYPEDMCASENTEEAENK